MKPPSTITILIDSRERIPLLFPKSVKWHPDRSGKSHLILVKEKVVTLPAGDYTLEGYDDESVVERKGSVREVLGNLFTKDRRRSVAAFQRLIEACEHPYLLLDFSLSEMFTVTEHVPNPMLVLDTLLADAGNLGVTLLWGGNCKPATSRRRLGEVVLRLLLSHALRRELGPIDIQGIIDDHFEIKEEPDAGLDDNVP